MARYLTVSAIGGRVPSVGAEPSTSAVVDAAVSYWKSRIAEVLPDRPDLIALPEVCDRPEGIALDDRERLSRFVDERGDAVLEQLARIARENRCYITYPAARRASDGTLRNSIRLVDRAGEVAGVYDKNHLTIGEIEKGVVCGAEAPVIECDFGRVGCAICYDLNFDALRERYVCSRPDLVIFSSMYHGGLMQRYWAYSCRAHFVAAIGAMGGYVLSPVGETVAESTNYYDRVSARVNLDCEVVHLDYNWDGLRKARRKYGTKVKVFDPGLLGSVLISSETDEFGARDVVKEFGIELLDDYFARALEAQAANRAAT